jgi:NADH-ubiquinone oxidoreductase chain 2
MLVLYCSFLIGLSSLYLSSLDRGIGLFGGLFHASAITHTFQVFIFIVSAIILQITAFYPRRVLLQKVVSLISIINVNFDKSINSIRNKRGEQFTIIEYPLIILFIITGAVFLVSTSDLVSIFLSIELQSYGLYLLSSIYRNSELATNGGLIYFLLGGLSSCFILLGTSLLYSNSGTTNMDSLYVITSLSDMTINNTNISVYEPSYIHMSLLILSVGFLFKVSAAPFHF